MTSDTTPTDVNTKLETDAQAVEPSETSQTIPNAEISSESSPAEKQDDLPKDEMKVPDGNGDAPAADTGDGDGDGDSELKVDPDVAQMLEDGEGMLQELKDDSVEGFFKHTDSAYCICINPTDETKVVSGGGDEVSYLWSLEDGEDPIAKLEGHTDSITCCGFSPDGKYIATGAMDSTIRLYDGTSGEFVRALEGPSGEIEWLKWHKKGMVIMCGASDGTTWLFQASNGECLRVFSGHTDSVTCGDFDFKGKNVITCSRDSTSFVFSVKSNEPKHHLKGRFYHGADINCMASHPTGPMILTGSEDGTAILSNLKSGKPVLNVDIHKSPIESVSFSQSHPSWFCVASIDGLITVWDTEVPTRPRCRYRAEGGVIKTEWHPTEAQIYCACLDGTLLLVDARSGELVQRWYGNQTAILDFAVTSNGRTIVTAGDDHTCLVFKLKEPEAADAAATSAAEE